MKKTILLLSFLMSVTALFAVDPSTLAKSTATLTRPQVPQKVDDYTTWFGIGSEDTTLVYSYSVTFSLNEISRDDFETAMKPSLINIIITTASSDQSMKNLCQNRICFEHIYYGSDGNILGDITITPEDYKSLFE